SRVRRAQRALRAGTRGRVDRRHHGAEGNRGRVPLPFRSGCGAGDGARCHLDGCNPRPHQRAGACGLLPRRPPQEDGSLRRVAVAHERPGAEPMLAAGATIEAGAPLEAVESGHVQGATGNGTGHPVCSTIGVGAEVVIGGDGPGAVRGAGPPLEAVESGRVQGATGNGTGHHVCSTIGVDAEVVIGGYVTVPICGRDRPLGAVTFGYADNRRCIDPLHVLTVKELAKRAGLALSNAKLYEVAQSAVRSRNEVLGMVSHDLRLPLNTIVATLSLLSDSMPERRSDVRNWVEIIDRATWQIQHLIEDLLDVSRMESDEFTVEQHAASVVTM